MNLGTAHAIPAGATEQALADVVAAGTSCRIAAPASYWQVNQSDVERIDEALMQYLERQGLVKMLRSPLSAYGRQYLGYNRSERRFVYVNAFMRSSSDTKSMYVRWCDGGNLFWGIEYDMQEKIFTGFEIDGVAAPSRHTSRGCGRGNLAVRYSERQRSQTGQTLTIDSRWTWTGIGPISP
jgi:hypothetical protein